MSSFHVIRTVKNFNWDIGGKLMWRAANIRLVILLDSRPDVLHQLAAEAHPSPLILELLGWGEAPNEAVEPGGHLGALQGEPNLNVQDVEDPGVFLEEVLLVIVFSFVKLLGCIDLGLYGAGPEGDLFPEGGFSQRSLLRGVVVDNGHVLPGTSSGGVMILPKDIQQLLVLGLQWIPFHINGLGIVINVFISGIGHRPQPRISNPGPDNPFLDPQDCLRCPKAGHGEGRPFAPVVRLIVQPITADIPEGLMTHLNLVERMEPDLSLPKDF